MVWIDGSRFYNGIVEAKIRANSMKLLGLGFKMAVQLQSGIDVGLGNLIFQCASITEFLFYDRISETKFEIWF